MAKQTIGIGSSANDGTGDPLRSAFQKINSNTDELYTAVDAKADAAATTSALSAKAPLASPALTGTPTAPTASASTSTTQIATTAMVQAAIAAGIAAQDVLVFKGAIDCSTNPNYPAADAGHVYRVSVAGKIGGSSGAKVEAGDVLTCVVDSSSAGTQSSVGANWVITQANLDGAVIGPASATDARIAVFDGTTGKLIKDGGSSIADILSGASDVAATIHAATSKTTPVDADELGLVDSADSDALKKLTWANLKATLKSYFDALYLAIPGAWSTWTPTITPEGGSLTSYSITNARYKTMGKVVVFSVTYQISNNGTATGAFFVSLPATAAYRSSPVGNNVSTGKLLSVGLSGGSMSMYAYDGTHPATTGETVNVSGIYEAA